MNIWYVHPYAGGPGIGRYWRPYHFSYYWNRSGHRSTVVTSGYHHLLQPDKSHYASTTVDGVFYAYVPTPTYRGNGLARMLSMLVFSILLLPRCLLLAISRGRPDAIIYSSPHPFAVVSCWMAARLLRATFVFEVRDIWPLSLVELGGWKASSLLTRITAWIERFAYVRADKVISLLPYAEQHMLNSGLAPGKFSWIPNGVDATGVELPPIRPFNELVQRVQVLREQGVFVIIYAGAHGEPNVLEGLIRSSGVLKEHAANIRIVMVGKGERKTTLQAIAEQCSGDLVEFYDQQSKEDVMAALKFASAGYLSLKLQPIFRFGISPNKLWDYMFAGLPIIFACQAGNDPVSEYGCGVSVNPEDPEEIADAVRRLMALSDSERSAMGRRGQEAVLANYSYKKLAGRFLQRLGHRSYE